MQKRPSYFELLRDPRWQQMRLRIMERESFMCEDCGDASSTLNVHHSYYEKGCAPWEYPEYSLHCLCEACHKVAEMERVALNRQIGRLSGHQLGELIGYARALEMESGDTAREHVADNHEQLVGMVRLFAMLSHHDTDRCVNRLIQRIPASRVVTTQMLFDAVAPIHDALRNAFPLPHRRTDKSGTDTHDQT